MQTAFYYDRAIPPRQWLVWAALLWDHVHMSMGLDETLRSFPEYTRANADASFLLQVMLETDICATGPPALDRDQLPVEQQPNFDRHFKNVGEALERILAGEPQEAGKRYEVTAEQLVDLHSLGNQALLPRKFTAAFPRFDFFLDRQIGFVRSGMRSALVIQAMESLVPTMPAAISVPQLQSFRAENMLQRSRFADAVTSVLNDVAEVSTEHEFNAKLRFVHDLLKEQLSLLECRYQQNRIETVKRVFGFALAPPAMLSALGSLLHVPIWQPAAVVAALSLAAADYLSTRDKNRAELRTAPWAYLLDLKQL